MVSARGGGNLIVWLAFIIGALGFWGCAWHGKTSGRPERGKTFTNPVMASGCDPWVIRHGGYYYYCGSTGRKIYIRRSGRLQDLGKEKSAIIWSAPETGMMSQNVWAPELHRIQGRWYVYFAADDGHNKNHRMWVLESEDEEPTGGFTLRGSLDTEGWAIDGTPLVMDDGSLYFTWSGWAGPTDGQQNLYISHMESPLALRGGRTLIAEPDQPWERNALPLLEGPQILRRKKRLFIIYSASGSWTQDYCYGLLSWNGGEIACRESWEKRGPVFEKGNGTWGVGHGSFTKSPDGREDWMVYHAKSKPEEGWGDRQVHIQRFTWDAGGYPVFGEPVGPGREIPVPSERRGLFGFLKFWK